MGEGADIYGGDIDSLVEVVHALLGERGETVAVAESLTGGLVGECLTAPPGASATFRGGVIAYATEVKAAVLGVPESLLSTRGAVDPQVAEAMATGVRRLLGATYGLGLTGVAGPGPQEGKRPGTLHVALAGLDGCQTASAQVPGDRRRIRHQAAASALEALRRHLSRLPPLEGGGLEDFPGV